MIYKEKGEKQKKKYLIAVEERHSHVALFAGILVFFCTMVAVTIWAQNYHQNGEPPLHYFTALSNILSSIGDGIELTIPLDILTLMTDRYDVPLNKLVNAYVTGAEHAMRERGIGRKTCRTTVGEEMEK